MTGDVWRYEHGPQGGDEVDLLRAGRNYGWPVVGCGVNYTTGRAIHEGTMREGMQPPAFVRVPSIGVGGMFFHTGNAFPGRTGWSTSRSTGGHATPMGRRRRFLQLEPAGRR